MPNENIQYAPPAPPSPKIVPNQFFYSVFRNVSPRTLYIWWAGTHGMNIKAGAYFTIEGDPRLPQILPRCHSRVESIKEMLELGLIEFCSSPPVILDDNLPNGESMTLTGNNGSPAIGRVPLTRTEVEERGLPIIEPDVSYDEENDLIRVDWTTAADLLPYDTFSVTVTDPSDTSFVIRTAQDRLLKYVPKAGYGRYTFKVMIQNIDKRMQEGTPVGIDYEDPDA